MKNILLMNFGGIGDEILFLPVVKSLKEEFSAHTFPCRTANAQKQKISS